MSQPTRLRLEPERPTRLAGHRAGFAFCLLIVCAVEFQAALAPASGMARSLEVPLAEGVRASSRQDTAIGGGAVALLEEVVAGEQVAGTTTMATRNANDQRPSGALPIWRAGSPLAASPAVGPDGAIYVASRQGTLEVLEASGALRFAITLGGAPTGSTYVDGNGDAYFGLATGKIVAVSAQGQRHTVFVSPTGISGGVRFSEGLGLLFSAPDGVVFGTSRMGLPTVRLGSRGPISAGPLGIGAWCVAVTVRGEMIWGDRMGRRMRQSMGRMVRRVLATPNGGLWALSERQLIGFTSRLERSFLRDGIVAMATIAGQPFGDRAIQGAVMTTEHRIEWLDDSGVSNHVAELAEDAAISAESLQMAMDGQGRVWVQVAPGDLVVAGPTGLRLGKYSVGPREILEPVFDSTRRRTIVGTVAGEVFALAWPPAALDRD